MDIEGGHPPIYVLHISMSNRDSHAWAFEFGWPIEKFPVWVLENGVEVPLTSFGNNFEPRGGPPRDPSEYYPLQRPVTFHPGETKEFSLDLTPLFEFQPGSTYTVIAETELQDNTNISHYKYVVGSTTFSP